MLYTLELGPVEQNIVKQAIRHGEPVPANILNAPVLKLGLELYFDAFFDLDCERSHGFGLTRLPLSAIRDYAVANEFSTEQTEDAIKLLRLMDNAHLQRLKAESST